MRNRWGKDIRVGMSVKAHHPRGGHIEGTVKKIYKMSGYGLRATLDNGHDIALDDVIEVRSKNPMGTHFRQAISVKYSGPTNTRDSKMIATSASGHRLIYPYDHGKDVAENAAAAAKALARKLDWKGTMIGGGTKDGFVFVFDAGPESRVENPMRRGYRPKRGVVPPQLRRYLFKRKKRR